MKTKKTVFPTNCPYEGQEIVNKTPPNCGRCGDVSNCRVATVPQEKIILQGPPPWEKEKNPTGVEEASNKGLLSPFAEHFYVPSI